MKDNSAKEKIIINIKKKFEVTKIKKSTTPGIPRRSPIQVLTGPDVA